MPVLPATPASAPAPSVLVADDQPDVLEALRLLLKGEGFEVETVASSAGVLAALERRDYDALLMDMNYARDTTSGREGLDLLQRLKELEPDLPVAVMTAWGSVGGAVEAMRRGAQDYIEKPWDNARLLVTLRNLVELGRALRRTRRLDAENRLLRRDGRAATTDGRGDGPPPLIAESPKMRPVLELIERVGPSDANVLVTGEHGTGKELVAQWLHASSSRAARSFIPVNMGGLSEGVFESELFGHVKGAFTDAKTDRVGRFELADGGAIFLDEIANITLSQQAKLLRVLQTGDVERVGSSRPRRVDVRVLSATNVDLQQEVGAGGSARTCCFDSTRSRFDSRPCASGEKIFRCSRRTSFAGTRRGTGSRSPGSTPARCSCCWPTHGRATSGSWTTPSSVQFFSLKATRCAPPTSRSAPAAARRSDWRICRWRTSNACSFRRRWG